MKRNYGTVSIGVRTPIIREGDNLSEIVIDSVVKATKDLGMSLNDKDVIAVTESIVARSEGNYATVDDIADDIYSKFGNSTVGLIFPILSRNRFAICLKGIARGVAKGSKKMYILLSYPSDEVGNKLISDEVFYNSSFYKDGIPMNTVLNELNFRKFFGEPVHEFTGVNYVEYYKSIVESEGCSCEIIFGNDASDILFYTKNVLCCDIHTRGISKMILSKNHANMVYTLTDILSKSINGSGYNSAFGLLGSNKSTEEKIKLFPINCQKFVEEIQRKIYKRMGVAVEVMVYGDGAFKDPQGKIWELADPVVSPGYTAGLIGTPNELKLKYLADNDFKDLSGIELEESIKKSIENKSDNLVGNMASQGTTPRQLRDLLGSLSDLTSGSGDKGTPVVLIKGYFDNYSDEN